MSHLNVEIYYTMPPAQAARHDSQVYEVENAIAQLRKHAQHEQDEAANNSAHHLFFTALRDLVTTLYDSGDRFTKGKPGEVQVTFSFTGESTDDGTEVEASGGALFDQTSQMQEVQMSFNLQYLQLQNTMQNENRQFTMVSNIMKTKHDTVKNSISNIR